MNPAMPHGLNRPAHSIPVYRAENLRVVDGANLGDNLSFATELMLEDCYHLIGPAPRLRLSLHAGDTPGRFTIAEDSETGTHGGTVIADSCLTFMSRDGDLIEMVVLVELDADGMINAIHGLPLAAMTTQTDYLLVGIDRDTALSRMAEVATAAFTRGTHITLSTGEQRRIEDLTVGDRVLTRDDGPQPIRWIGQSTVRAVGEFAPILISQGTLHNSHDLIVSPDHRLFIYQRTDEIGVGRSEVLVKARHLVNGDSIRVMDGGFVDYFQLLFDRHQIIYAEGIAAETLLVDQRTGPALPPELIEKINPESGDHGDTLHQDFEVQGRALDRRDIADLLRRATSG